MKGAPRTLHIRCGDDIRDKLVEAGIEGDYLSFADPAWLGPPPASNAWIAGRAALIAERTGQPRQEIRADLGDAYWRLARAPADYARIVLWFEHDLYDQAALVRVLAGFALRKNLPGIELIAIDRFRGIKRFIARRKRIGRGQLTLGAKAWAALRAPAPEPLEALCKSDLRALPFLKIALQRQLQELPWTNDGLSLTERNALVALAKGSRSAAEVYADAQMKRDPQPFMGDLFFWSVLRDLIDAPRPPIAVSAGTRRAAWPRRLLRLTSTGKALLAGKLDWQRTGPLERWVGGIAVAPDMPAWRWNPRAGRVA